MRDNMYAIKLDQVTLDFPIKKGSKIPQRGNYR